MIYKTLGIIYLFLKFAYIIFLISLPTFSFASIKDYIYPSQSPSFSNYGTLGLIQMPNARMFSEGTLAFSWTDNDPYLRGSIVAYPFSWFEASYQYTDVNNPVHRSMSLLFGEQSRDGQSVMPDDLGYDLRSGDLDQFGRLQNFGQFKDIVGAEDAEQFFKYLNDPKNKRKIYDNFVRQRKHAPYDRDPYRDHDPREHQCYINCS